MTKLGSQKLHICPKVTKMGSIIGHRIDYNGVGALRGSPPGKKKPDEMHYFIYDPLVLMENLCYRLTELQGILHKEHKV